MRARFNCSAVLDDEEEEEDDAPSSLSAVKGEASTREMAVVAVVPVLRPRSIFTSTTGVEAGAASATDDELLEALALRFGGMADKVVSCCFLALFRVCF